VTDDECDALSLLETECGLDGEAEMTFGCKVIRDYVYLWRLDGVLIPASLNVPWNAMKLRTITLSMTYLRSRVNSLLSKTTFCCGCTVELGRIELSVTMLAVCVDLA